MKNLHKNGPLFGLLILLLFCNCKKDDDVMTQEEEEDLTAINFSTFCNNCDCPPSDTYSVAKFSI